MKRPRRFPRSFADIRAAWSSGELTRIEAAARDGRVVFFSVETQEAEDAAESTLDFDSLWIRYIVLGQLFWVALVIAAIVLARSNLLAGRSDLRGSGSLALFLFGTHLATWLLLADHVPDFGAETFRLQAAVGRILFDVGIVWLAYVAPRADRPAAGVPGP